jgi:hypothetical protein
MLMYNDELVAWLYHHDRHPHTRLDDSVHQEAVPDGSVCHSFFEKRDYNFDKCLRRQGFEGGEDNDGCSAIPCASPMRMQITTLLRDSLMASSPRNEYGSLE